MQIISKLSRLMKKKEREGAFQAPIPSAPPKRAEPEIKKPAPVKVKERKLVLEKSRLTIRRLYIHCSADLPWSQKTAAEIDRDHRARGWDGIGYHYVIHKDGKLVNGRSVHKMGAHAKPYNRASIGICMIGGLDKNARPYPEFTPAQWKTLEKFLAAFEDTYPDATVHGHNELGTKSCPSFVVKTWHLTGEVVPFTG